MQHMLPQFRSFLLCLTLWRTPPPYKKRSHPTLCPCPRLLKSKKHHLITAFVLQEYAQRAVGTPLSKVLPTGGLRFVPSAQYAGKQIELRLVNAVVLPHHRYPSPERDGIPITHLYDSLVRFSFSQGQFQN